MPHLPQEPHRGRVERVILGKLELGGEDAALEGRAVGALDQGFPEEDVVFGDGARGDAVGRGGGEEFVLVEEAAGGDGGCHGGFVWWWLVVKGGQRGGGGRGGVVGVEVGLVGWREGRWCPEMEVKGALAFSFIGLSY